MHTVPSQPPNRRLMAKHREDAGRRAGDDDTTAADPRLYRNKGEGREGGREKP